MLTYLLNLFIIHRADPEYRKYTGALVGLGFDPHTGQALLPDHDSEIVFEVDITQNDVVQVRFGKLMIRPFANARKM